MRLTAWHATLAISATTHVAVIGAAAASLVSVPPRGEAVTAPMRLTVVARAQAARPVHKTPPPRPKTAWEHPTESDAVLIAHLPAATRVVSRRATPRSSAQAPPRDPATPVAIAQLPRAADWASVSGAVLDSVDALPVAGTNAPPRYPVRARRLGWEGRVLLTVQITPDGTVAYIVIAESSGFAVLDEAAVDAVRRWRFTPARAAGVALASTLRVPIIFRLDEDATTP